MHGIRNKDKKLPKCQACGYTIYTGQIRKDKKYCRDCLPKINKQRGLEKNKKRAAKVRAMKQNG